MHSFPLLNRKMFRDGKQTTRDFLLSDVVLPIVRDWGRSHWRRTDQSLTPRRVCELYLGDDAEHEAGGSSEARTHRPDECSSASRWWGEDERGTFADLCGIPQRACAMHRSYDRCH